MNTHFKPILLALLLLFVSLPSTANTSSMSHEYAIVFIFRGSCGYCHQFAPSVTEVSRTLSLPVYGFSLDGGGVPGYEVPITATPEIHRTFMTGAVSNQVVPATFLINVNSRKFARISLGLVSQNVLYQGLSNALNDPDIQEALR